MVNLENVTADTTLNNGDVAKGILGGNYKISIAADATITLHQAQIYGRDSGSYPWAGLTCLGDATIILKSNDNEILGFSSYYPGIYVPVGCTLTIKGDGKLSARSNGKGAGIGSGSAHAVDCKACGNIVIEGGVINTTTGSGGAGIGSGDGAGDGSAGPSCGNIVIMGGDITVTKTGSNGVGIGSGGDGASCGSIAIMGGLVRAINCRIGSGDWNSSCGDILISEGVSYVNANSSTGSAIGAGSQGSTCGTVTIAKGLTQNGGADTQACEIRHLSNLQRDICLLDGSVLTGTLGGNYKVSIAAGATVTLRDATINGGTGDWAGLTCLGNATIILEGSNVVKGFSNNYAGISIDDGYTLAIKGDGSLDARGSAWAAGIGGSRGKACGNVVIEGGTITAMGGSQSPGIGSGMSGSCGNITIRKGVTSVTATMGSGGWYSIGSGKNGTCGTVTIGGEEGEIEESPYTYAPTRVNLAAQSGDYTAVDGDVLYGETTHTVTVPGGASVTINGVEVAGGGGAAAGVPSFAADAETATTKFVKGTDGKWRIVAFAELATGTAAGVEDMVSILRGSTPDAVETPVTPDSLFATNAVKVEAVVTPPAGAQQQFFKVKFGE